MNNKKTNVNRDIVIIIGLAVIFIISYFAVFNFSVYDSYTGEFIVANKVYLSDGGLNIVIYFNESSVGTHFLIFEGWDAKHSVQLSNMDVGENIKVTYRDYVFGCRTIVDIEVIE